MYCGATEELKKHLKTIFFCHRCRGILDGDGDGTALSVLDLDL